MLERILKEVEDGWGYSEQLKWILDDSYVPFLERRLALLPPKSHGLVFLPCFIYKEKKDLSYIVRMMREIIVAEDGWDQREAAIGGYLRELVGSEPIFLDFCRYVILYVKDISMKEEAMLWLAYQTGYPLEGLEFPDELQSCVHELQKSNGTDLAARALLDIVHTNTGHFSVCCSIDTLGAN